MFFKKGKKMAEKQNETNTPAKSIYEMMGYQTDGLKDFIFVKG